MTDPRLTEGFDPDLMPFCDGDEAPDPGTKELNQIRMIQFVSLFYLINSANRSVEEGRKSGNVAQERLGLERLGILSTARLNLEDKLAPAGFLADPIFVEGRCVDIRFTWPGRKPTASVHVQRFSVSADL